MLRSPCLSSVRAYEAFDRAPEHVPQGVARVACHLGRARGPDQLNRVFSRSVQLSPLGEWRARPFFRESSNSRSSLRWFSVSLTGVATAMWQYRSPG